MLNKLAFVPFDLAEPHISNGRLIPILEPWWPVFQGFHLYYASRRQVPHALKCIIDALRYQGSFITYDDAHSEYF